jgi:hypothetical protein
VVCVLVAEQTPLRAAFDRSWALFCRDWWRVGALFVLLAILLRLIVLVPLVAPSLLTLWLPHHPLGVVAHELKILALGALLGQLLVAPVAQIAVVLLYRDLRA